MPRQTKYINSITSFNHSWPDYGAKIKDQPNMRQGPNRPNWAPLLIIRERHVATACVLVELPLELKRVIWNGVIRPCNCFGSICESRGLSNLTPARSRLFKLVGKDGAKRWSCSKRLAYMVANIRKREREEKQRSGRHLAMTKK